MDHGVVDTAAAKGNLPQNLGLGLPICSEQIERQRFFPFFTKRRASSSRSKASTGSTGPKISSCITGASGRHPQNGGRDLQRLPSASRR